MCFTISDLPRSFSSGNNIVHLFLNTSRTFIVFVHDPKFFVYTYNPQAIPMTTWILPKTKTFVSLSLVEVTHSHLNLAHAPCEEEESYNFQVLLFDRSQTSLCLFVIPTLPQACIKKSLSTKIGCRLPWDVWSDRKTAICSHLNQFM